MSTEPKEATTAKKAAPRAESYDIAKSDETFDLAKDLAKFIKDNKLSTQVQGKEFVNVEGWQYAGSRLGIVPIVEHVINLSNDQEIKYQAKVTLFDLRHQTTVGAGFAICSNKESGRKFYQEFAIASMAQTRAIGKAYRNILAWIIRAAGYEPTPAEEMEYSGNVPAPAVAPAVVAATPALATQADSVPMSVSGGGVSDEAPVPVLYATANQKQEIIGLLNHPLVTRQEKTKMLLNINRLDEERATQAIKKLTRTIEDREGTTAVANDDAATTPLPGNELAGVTPAASSSDAPAPSTGADQDETLSIAGPQVPPERVAELTAAIEATASGIDLSNLWSKLTKNEAQAVQAVKNAKKTQLEAAKNQAQAQAARQAGAGMKVLGSDSSLVDEYDAQPVAGTGPAIDYAVQAQQDDIVRLLNTTQITICEKSKMLKCLKKLDRQRAKDAVLTLRVAIAQRSDTSPVVAARTGLRSFVLSNLKTLSEAERSHLNGLAENTDATLKALVDALAEAQIAREVTPPTAVAA